MPNKKVVLQQHCQSEPEDVLMYKEIDMPVPSERLGNESVDLNMNVAYGKYSYPWDKLLFVAINVVI